MFGRAITVDANGDAIALSRSPKETFVSIWPTLR